MTRGVPPWWQRQAAHVEEMQKAGYVYLPIEKKAGALGASTGGRWVQPVQSHVAGTSFPVQLHEEPPLSPEEEEFYSVSAGPSQVQSELF